MADFRLHADEFASFVLEQVEPRGESPSGSPDYVAQSFKDTSNFWRRWVGRSTYRGRWREMVNRSAMTLKLLTARPFGSNVAVHALTHLALIGAAYDLDRRLSAAGHET